MLPAPPPGRTNVGRVPCHWLPRDTTTQFFPCAPSFHCALSLPLAPAPSLGSHLVVYTPKTIRVSTCLTLTMPPPPMAQAARQGAVRVACIRARDVSSSAGVSSSPSLRVSMMTPLRLPPAAPAETHHRHHTSDVAHRQPPRPLAPRPHDPLAPRTHSRTH